MVAPPTLFVIGAQTVRPRPTEMRSHCARDWPSWFLRRPRSTRGGHDREVAQGERTACDPSHPPLTSHTSLFVRHASTGRALAPAHSSSDSLSWLGQRTHRRAHAATSKLTTADRGTSWRACLVKSSSACGQCMLGTGAQGADQDLLSIAVGARARLRIQLANLRGHMHCHMHGHGTQLCMRKFNCACGADPDRHRYPRARFCAQAHACSCMQACACTCTARRKHAYMHKRPMSHETKQLVSRLFMKAFFRVCVMIT
jgi:hypothetical protein